MADKRYVQQYKIFKPNKSLQGAASQWELNAEKGMMFVEFANQKTTEDKSVSFDWEDKIVMKLGVSDIGDILATLVGLQDGIGPKDGEGRRKGIYHQTDKGNTILQLAKKNGADVFYIRISKKPKNGQPIVATHSMTLGEGMVLSTLLRRAIEVIHLW